MVDVFEGVGQHSRRQDAGRANLCVLEKVACPGAGACGGQFTANTMACVAEAIGLALPYSQRPAGRDPGARRFRAEGGRRR